MSLIEVLTVTAIAAIPLFISALVSNDPSSHRRAERDRRILAGQDPLKKLLASKNYSPQERKKIEDHYEKYKV